MKQKYTGVLLLVLMQTHLLFGQKRIELINSTNHNRENELVKLKRDALSKILSKSDAHFGLVNQFGIPQQLQFDDLDNDGKWDEAVFLCSVKAHQKLIFKFVKAENLNTNTIQLAHVRQRRKNNDSSFGKSLSIDSIPAGQPNTDFAKVKLPPFLTEGPAWENDKVGFRIYFDVRNGKDIWGKTTSKMMMDSIGVDPSISYHTKSSWGMDVYKVGSSLSAGALAINIKLSNGKDSLVRLGGVNMGKVIYEKIADGPIRAIFRLKYPEWKIASWLPPVSLTEEISIWGGQYFYESKIKLQHAPPGAQLVSGFANFFDLKAEAINNKKVAAYYTFGKQSENSDNLGLAILTNLPDVDSFGKAQLSEKDIKDSYLVKYRTKKNADYHFRFYAAWHETDPRFRVLDTFKEFLTNEMRAAEDPLVVIFK